MSAESNAFSPESWEYARGYAGVFGATPSSFTSVIRSLINEHGAGLARSAGSNKYFVVRLLKSPSLMAPLYFLCEDIRPDSLVPEAPTSTEALVGSFTPLDLAYLLGLIYVTRRAKMMCDPEEWKHLEDPLASTIYTATSVGDAIPAIGIATSLMEATAPFLGVFAFLKHDPKGFKEYRRDLKRNGGGWDVGEEIKRWGCNHLQISSVIIQTLGFGIMRANALVLALSSSRETGTLDEMNTSRDIRMAQLWRKSLTETETAPTIPLPPKYYPTQAAQKIAVDRIKASKSRSSNECWLFKGKDLLPPYQQPPPSATDSPTSEESSGNSGTGDDIDEAISMVAAESGGEPA